MVGAVTSNAFGGARRAAGVPAKVSLGGAVIGDFRLSSSGSPGLGWLPLTSAVQNVPAATYPSLATIYGFNPGLGVWGANFQLPSGTSVGAPLLKSAGGIMYLTAPNIATKSVANYDCYISRDGGVTWGVSNINSSAYAIYDICYGNGVWVAIGNGGLIYYSTNGTSWTSAGNYGWNFFGVAYGNGTFVVNGYDNSGNFLTETSTNGQSWTQHSPTGPVNSQGNVVFWNGVFWVSDPSYSQIWTSSNGVNWGTRSFPTPSINAAFYNNTACTSATLAVSTSNNGNYYTQDGYNWSLTPPAGETLVTPVRLCFCYAGKAYSLYSTTPTGYSSSPNGNPSVGAYAATVSPSAKILYVCRYTDTSGNAQYGVTAVDFSQALLPAYNSNSLGSGTMYIKAS